MRKQLVNLLLTFIFCVTAVTPAFAAGANLPAAEKVAAMEKMLYGGAQKGSIIQRLDSLEEEVYGSRSSDAVLKRIDKMYDYLEGVPMDGQASFATRLNIAEWRINESMSAGPAIARLEAVETMLHGSAQKGALDNRLEELLELAAYENAQIPVQPTVLPMDSVFKIIFTEELSTKTNAAGDEISFKAADNLYVNDVLVLPKGANGVGTIRKVVQPSMFGKDGRIDIDFSYIYGVDGTPIKLTVGDLAKQEAESIAGAAGASIGSMVILGPVGIVGGAFVKGKSVTIPAGSETFVQTVEDVEMQGVLYTE